jgi:hypothetical protein
MSQTDNSPAPANAAETATPFDDGELYDVVLGDLAFGLDFYLGLAQEARGPVLDIACGDS